MDNLYDFSILSPLDYFWMIFLSLGLDLFDVQGKNRDSNLGRTTSIDCGPDCIWTKNPSKKKKTARAALSWFGSNSTMILVALLARVGWFPALVAWQCCSVTSQPKIAWGSRIVPHFSRKRPTDSTPPSISTRGSGRPLLLPVSHRQFDSYIS